MQKQAYQIKEFEIIFKQYYGLLMQISKYYLGNKEDAEEVVNEIFLKLWNAETEVEDSKLKSYLSIAVKNKSINAIRDRKKTISLKEHEDYEPSSTSFSDEQIIYKQTAEQISQAINTLPEQCKIIFKLHRQHQYTYHQIAEILEISPKTVENQMGKALKTLRILLKDTFLIILLAKLENI